jgi:hypothetical protein
LTGNAGLILQFKLSHENVWKEDEAGERVCYCLNTLVLGVKLLTFAGLDLGGDGGGDRMEKLVGETDGQRGLLPQTLVLERNTCPILSTYFTILHSVHRKRMGMLQKEANSVKELREEAS